MSSPGLTVNDVMAWLERVRRITLPTLPFSGVWQRLTALFKQFITGALPSPKSPLPWTIDVGAAWDGVIPGTKVSIDSIQILVSDRAGVPSPPTTPPRVRSTRRVPKPGKPAKPGKPGKPSVRVTPGRRAVKRRRRRQN